jgi:hypothetical protein
MVKGIDNQIMIHRTAEYARQMAARNDHAENAKEFTAHLEQQRAVQGGRSVSRTEQAERKTVPREKNEDSKNDGDGQNKKKAPDEAEEEQQEGASGPDKLGNEIDIII